jgi:hypothetical protein
LRMSAAMAGLTEPEEREFVDKIGRYYSPSALRVALKTLNDAAVMAACIEGMSLAVWLNPTILAMAEVVMAKPPATTEKAGTSGQEMPADGEETARLVSPYTDRLSTAALSFDPMDDFRLQIVLFQIAVRAHLDEFAAALSEHQTEALNMLERAGIMAALDAEEKGAGPAEGSGDQEPIDR